MDRSPRRVFNEIQRLKKRVERVETGIKIDLGNSKSAGVAVVLGASTDSGVSTGHLVYLDSAKEWKKASAGHGGVGADSLIGVATTTSPHVGGVLVHGLYNLDSSYVSGTANKEPGGEGGGYFLVGAQVYMHPEHSGSYTTTLPSGSSQTVRVVGHAVDTTIIYFAPSPDYIKI